MPSPADRNGIARAGGTVGPAREYRLGPAVLRLAALRESSVPTREAAMPVLRRLAEATERQPMSRTLWPVACRPLPSAMPPNPDESDDGGRGFPAFDATASGCRRAGKPSRGEGLRLAATPGTLTPCKPASRIAAKRLGRNHSTMQKDVQGLAVPLFRCGGICSAPSPSRRLPRMTPALHATIVSELIRAGTEITALRGGDLPEPIATLWRRAAERTRNEGRELLKANKPVALASDDRALDSLNTRRPSSPGPRACAFRDVDGTRCGLPWRAVNVNLGYSCQPVKDAIAAQLDALPITRSSAHLERQGHRTGEVLRDFFAPDGLTRAFYTSGGSDLVETALRLARQYHKIRGEAGR